jgi:hypothetical protein
MSNQTSEAFAYIERECKDAKGRVELQRRVVEQLHMAEADAGEAEAALSALLDDEASGLFSRVVVCQLVVPVSANAVLRSMSDV